MSMQRLQESIRATGLSNEYVQRRNIGVPFDERGNAAEPRDRERIEIPHCIAHRTRVGIDQNREVTVRIFNLAGQLVRVLEKVEGTQFLKWDLLNQSLIPVASGVYVAYVDMGEVGEKTLKLVIIQEAEVLPVY